MMKISTRTHACLDIATVAFAIAFPRLLGASKPFTRAATILALGKLGYALVTRHELGVAKMLPMKTHLALDAAGGVMMGALPFVQRRRENAAVTACALGMGLMDMAVAPLTDSQSKPRVDEVHVVTPTDTMTATGAGDAASEPKIAKENRLPTASLLDSSKVVWGMFMPNVAKGAIIRRPRVVAMSEKLGVDTAAVKMMQQLRRKYGNGPLMLKVPFRNQAVLLDPDHVRRVLDESPEPFATASTEKQAALAHLEPHGVLISHGPARRLRRELNDQVLESKSPIHHMAGAFLPIVDDEIGRLLNHVKQSGGELRWDDYIDAIFAIVRRVIFGNGARDDRRITDLAAWLRADANWAFAKPRRTDLRDELHGRIRAYLDKAEPNSLCAYMATKVRSDEQKPEGQIPQWLFAFDAAAMASFRALALLATHPQHLDEVRQETTGGAVTDRPMRPLLRAAMLEALRLWPTTPMILRQTTRQTEWDNGIMPARTGVLLFAPFFHRDDERLPFANTFHPNLWIEDDANVCGFPPREWPFVPFSGGTAHCPAQNLVLLLTSGVLAGLIDNHTVRLRDPHRLPPGKLPGTLDSFTLRFEIGGIRSRSGATPSAAALAS